MNTRITASVVAGLLVCLGVAVPVSGAQAPCTAQTLTGTYAFYDRGSSSILDPDSEPYPYHWAGAIAPFAALGKVTLGPDGIGRGVYWITIGSFTAGPEPVPVELAITELNPDCTGKWQFEFNLLGTPYTIEERFILFDNGRQFRSIPTVTGVPTMAYVGEGHRISKPGEALHTCGPQTAHGGYVMAVESLVKFGPNPLFADAVLVRFDAWMNGEFSGMMYEKLGPVGNIELPVWGLITVNPDCTFAMTLNFAIQGVPATVPIRGVFFDQGRQFYAMDVSVGPGGIQYSIGQGTRIIP
jgi:hypothetical protein